MTTYGHPQSTRELRDQIDLVSKDIEALLAELPSSETADEISRHFYFLENRLELADIRLKPEMR